MAGSVWDQQFYPREGHGLAFDRVVFFSDAVFAIALTLAAVEIGIPELAGDATSPGELWQELWEEAPKFAGYVVAFVWVAVYWLANHRFTATLRGVTRGYVRAVVVYLALIALLPIPASMLGEYFENPLAVAMFAIYATLVSGMEVVLFVVADRASLFPAPLTPAFRRLQVVGSLSPLPPFLLSIPVAFWSTGAAILLWFVGAVAVQLLLSRTMSAQPPPDPPTGN